MEAHRGNEPETESKHSSADREQSRASTVVKLPSDSVNEVPLEPPPSGKLRRTAFRFFGGRKSICVLPSFFGGRSKHLNKWSSKKGVSKSKTHDGLTKASWEESPGSVPAGDFEYHGQKDATGKPSNSCSSEFGHPVGDQKSSSLPRQKKGLRGLFSSIRRHKKNRNVEFEKNEMVPMSYVSNKEVPVAEINVHQNNTECLGSLSEPYVPDLTNAEGGVTTAPECIDVGVTVSENNETEQSLKSGSEDQVDGGDRPAKTNNPTTSDRNPIAQLVSLPNIDGEAAVNSQPSVASSDQISMIFGDVASLKSFDSLTGCGDIIADQDDDSIVESTVSGERSSNAGKRSSCYVTYQGGGEDMATPDEVDGDYLQDLWENEAADDFAHDQNQIFAEHADGLRLTPDEPSSSHQTDVSSTGIGALTVTETTVTSGDLLTPQSDHQESVPNSDEGYYDSTTPGPDEEGHDRCDRIKRDRLPRDSYSGDALYELFGPDDSLISPAFESQFKLPGPDAHRFLDMPVDVRERPAFGHVTDSLEPEKPCLTKQSMCQESKELPLFTKALHDQGLKDCTSLLNSKTRASMKDDPVITEAFNQIGNMPHASHASKEKSSKHSNGGKFGNPAFGQSQEHHPEKNKPTASQLKNNKDISKETTRDLEDDLTVCFSQALVDFTKHSTAGMGGSESSSPFAQNMQALPAIVTFDVVDMDNEGEYDQQIDVTIEEEEDIASPYEVFEESYLQKDAFAECDDRMFDLYEQSLLSNTWAIASLPRHLSLTRVNQSMPSPLALNRRSRSLDTDSLELEMTDLYLGSGPAPVSYHRAERGTARVSSLHRKKNGHPSTASEMKDATGFACLSWQPDTERNSALPLTNGKRADKTHGLGQTHRSGQAGSPISSCKSPQLTVNTKAERTACHFNSPSTGLNRPCHLPLQSEAGVPPRAFPGVKREDSFPRSDLASDGGGEGLFYSSSVNSQPYSQRAKMRPVGVTQGMPHSGAPPNPLASEGDMGFVGRARKAADTAYPLKHTAGANL